MMRKTFITLSLFAIAFVATSAHAQEFIPLAPIPGLTTGITADQAGLANFLNNLYKYLIGLAAVIAVVEIIWGGLLYSTQDVPGSKTNGKEKIQNALLGLVLVLSPVLVFSIINPSILNLSINLPALDTKSGTSRTGTNLGGATPPPATGCTTVHTGPYFENAICASQNDATSYTCKNGLTLQVPTCKVSDAATGKCLDKSAFAYCAGKTLIVSVYQYYWSYIGTLKGDAQFVPSDSAAATAFMTGCQSDGGVYSASRTAAAIVFLTRVLGVHTYQTTATNGCSPSYGTILFDSSKGGGIVCYSNRLSCNPPQ